MIHNDPGSSSLLFRMDKLSMRKFLIQQNILGGLVALLGECTLNTPAINKVVAFRRNFFGPWEHSPYSSQVVHKLPLVTKFPLLGIKGSNIVKASTVYCLVNEFFCFVI